ncbi:MAG: hypothetical protein ACR2P2_12350, partial [Nakamurella sp.]
QPCDAAAPATLFPPHPATGTLAVLLTNRLHALVGTQAQPAPAVAPDIAPLWAGVVNAAIPR